MSVQIMFYRNLNMKDSNNDRESDANIFRPAANSEE